MNEISNEPFKSQRLDGAVMNIYGVVIYCGKVQEPCLRDEIVREAMNSGWKKVAHPNKDIGQVWQGPQ